MQVLLLGAFGDHYFLGALIVFPLNLLPCFRHLLAFHQELRPTLDELGVLLPEVELLCSTPQPHFMCDT